MKHVYYSLICCLFTFSGSAQRSANLALVLNSPADNTTVAAMSSFTINFTVSNAGPDNITTSDSLKLYVSLDGFQLPFEPGGQYYLLLPPTAIANGGQATFNRAFSFNDSFEGSTVELCTRVEVMNAADPVMDSDSSEDEKCVSIIINSQTASLEEPGRNVNIWPNPAGNSIRFSTDINADHLTVKDPSGKTMNVSVSAENVVSLEGIASGTYFLHLETTEGVIVRKFMKQ